MTVSIIKDKLFYLAATLLIIRTIIGDSFLFEDINTYIGKYLSIGVILILSIIIVFQKYNIKVFFTMIIIGIISIYTSIVTQSNFLIYIWLICFAIKNKNIDKVITIFLKAKIFLLLIHAMVFGYMYLTNKGALDIVQNSIGRTRYLMYFASQNKISQYYIFSLLEYIYLKREKISLVKLIIIWIISYTLWFFSGSDSIIMCVIVLSILIIFSRVDIIRKFVDCFSKYGFIILSVTSIIFSIIYNKFDIINSILCKIDHLFSGRINLASNAIDLYGFTFLGQTTEFGRFFFVDNKYIWYLFVDNAYVYLSITIGWFYLIVLSVLFYKGNKNLVYRDKIFICIYYLYALAENSIIYTETFVPILISVYALINNKGKLVL